MVFRPRVNALAYRTNNELARKIRFAAVKHHGGCTYYNIPEGEFFFDSDSCAFAVYANGAEVRLDKQTTEMYLFIFLTYWVLFVIFVLIFQME